MMAVFLSFGGDSRHQQRQPETTPPHPKYLTSHYTEKLEDFASKLQTIYLKLTIEHSFLFSIY